MKTDMPPQLRLQQKTAFEKMQSFLKNKEQDVFILRGYAGTGKTTLLSAIADWAEREQISVQLLATTGRATKILRDKSKKIAKTIHSEIYSFSHLNLDLEKLNDTEQNFAVDEHKQLSLIFNSNDKQDRKKIYIIDEASMLSDIKDNSTSFATFGSGNLLNDLFLFAPQGKFIFVGDPCQLPPVKCTFSPALEKSYLEDTYGKKVISLELTEIIRQDFTNDIIDASMKIRHLWMHDNNSSWGIFPVGGYPERNIFIENSEETLIEKYVQILRENGFHFAGMLAHSNTLCHQLNKHIRSLLNLDANNLEKGDVLLINQNSNIVNLVNGDLGEVLDIGDFTYQAGLTFLNVTIRILSSKEDISTLLIKDLLFSNRTCSNLNPSQHKALYINFYRRMKERKIEQNTPEFDSEMIRDPYLNALRATFGYAITCHKAQGGEWEEVFLYMTTKIQALGFNNNRQRERDNRGLYQWWYTALTRAKNKVHLIQQPFIKPYTI